MNEVVLDASAILALVKDEPGADFVAEWLRDRDGVLSSVNLAESVSKLVDDGWPGRLIQSGIAGTGAQPVPFLVEDAYVAGLLRERTRHRGLSLGDRACLALALRLGAPALTADRSWQDLDVGIEVLLIR